MIRLFFSLFFWVIVARWGYEEVKIFSPEAIPLLDTVLEHITPTTHDKWPRLVYEPTAKGTSLTLVSRETGEPIAHATVPPSAKVAEIVEHLSNTTE